MQLKLPTPAETLDELTDLMAYRWLDGYSVLHEDVTPIEDGMMYFENPYTLTRDRWEIERACGKPVSNDIGFGLIYYEKRIPRIVWGGQGLPCSDSPLQLLHYKRR